MTALSKLFNFSVTSGGNFRLSEVLSISFGVEGAEEFLYRLNRTHPNVFGDLSFDYENGRLVAGITPIGLVKLAMLLPLDDAEPEDAVWLATLRENVANYAIMYAATFQGEAEEEEDEEFWSDISSDEFIEMLEDEFKTSDSLPFGLLITDDGQGNILEITKQL